MTAQNIYKQPELLTPEAHKDLTFSPTSNFKFSANTNAVPAVTQEFPDIATRYPIAFVRDEKMGIFIPMAILSLRKDGHDSLDEDGKWKESYAPVFLRRYPFIMDSDNRIIIDRSAENFSGNSGERLITNQGAFQPKFGNIKPFLEEIAQQESRSAQFTHLVSEQKLFKKMDIPLQVAGRPFSLDNLYIIDEEKIKDLPDNTITEWVKNGIMGIIYCHLISLKRFNDLATKHTAFLIETGAVKVRQQDAETA